ncbi:MAG: CinA family protein [Nitratireductor sp.]|nr:CinA family protein [Nitratireductor sp.]MCB1459259.1 CinA family protein [Nitratireductor sp.]
MQLDPELAEMAEHVLDGFRAEGLKIATAESCTGGLIAALLTSIAGSSDVFERGFVTYSNEAKAQAIGVDPELIREHGAVSAPVAVAMAIGALEHSLADASVSVTGIAGPGGGSAEKPVGLVFIAVANRLEEGAFVEEFRFRDTGRDEIRNETSKMAFEMLLAYGIAESDDRINQN